MREEASRIAGASRRLGTGANGEAAALAAIRRSCAARAVTRLDEVAPASVETEAATGSGTLLFQLDLRRAGAAVEAADASAALRPGTAGVELEDAELRTTSAPAIPRDSIGTIEIDATAGVPGQLLLGWSEDAAAPRLRRNSARVDLVADGREHTYAIDAASALVRGLEPGSSVRRFFVAAGAAGPVTVAALRVLPRAHRYAASAWGRSSERRGGELRSVLYERAPTSLAFDVNVPTTSPVLEAGLGVLAGDGVLEMEVAVRDGQERTVLLKRLVKGAPWEDVSLDLARWAGRRVQVSLAVRGSRDAVALWSSPLVRPRLADDRTEPFLVILEDAMRADRLSLYGGPVPTPAHERLAAAGVTFERAFAQATQTRPSVASMMTSLMPSATGSWDFSDALSDRFVTLAEALRACGFATASFLQNGNAGPYAGLAQGFDVVFDEDEVAPHASGILGAGSALERWTAAQRGRPWFAYVHVLDPHGPYDPVQRPDLAAAPAGPALLRDKSIDPPWLDTPTAEARRRLYDAGIAANDAALASFLDRFEASGDLARAVVAVVADHGEFLGEHGGMWRHHFPGYLEVSRVPFVLRAPGATPSRVAAPVALLDLMPTLLELAGADASSLPMHGRSLAATLEGKRAPYRAVVSDEMAIASGQRSARGCGSFASGDSLLLLSCTKDSDYSPDRLLPLPASGPQPLRVFSLAAPTVGTESEAGSLAGAIVESLSRSALREMQEENLAASRRIVAGASEAIASEPATSERLRALGYAE